VHVEQSFDAPGARTQTLDAHFDVTAPRFVLPPDQVLSTFPPNQAQGEFNARLPQIVLKRRTVPWERTVDGSTDPQSPLRQVPWLALVVLADAEAEFVSARPIAECITPGVTLDGRNDATVGNAIRVTAHVIAQVFPTKDELPLLAHVRNVDLNDTELALGGDDGWLAVLIANRLPQPGVRYRACLVSLEGQYDALPDTAAVAPDPGAALGTTFVYPEAIANLDQLSSDYVARVDSSASLSLSAAMTRGGPTQTVSDAWSRGATGAPVTGVSNAPNATTAALIGAMHAVSIQDIDPLSPILTFPVLAHWQFTCTGAGDFRSIMQGLDVGMLGTSPPAPPPPRPGRKPPPPSRPQPTVLDTGHVALAYTSRAGEPRTVWYRGPLVPRPVDREMPDANGVLPLFHSSDQARRVGPDGRENLSLAAAFEIGRLLALAEPSVVAALLNWRKEGFETARRTALLDADAVLARQGVRDLLAGYASRLQRMIIVDLGADGAQRLGGIVPPIDPGRPIPGLDDVNPVQLIATGFGLPVEVVAGLLDPGATRPGTIVVPVAQVPSTIDTLVADVDRQLAPLRGIATEVASGITANALAGTQTPGGGAPDALDRLLGGLP
jgi:hypothetical protein